MSYHNQQNDRGGFYQPSQQFQFPQGTISFDGSSSVNSPSANAANFTNEQLPNGIINAFSTCGYSYEPALIEELGINFTHIMTKTKSVLTPTSSFNLPLDIFNNADLSGPLLFYFIFGMMLLTAGKMHFGYIYGVALFGSLSLYQFLKLMAGQKKTTQGSNFTCVMATGSNSNTLSFLRTASILGYSFLPLCFLSTFGIFFSLDNWIGYIAGLISVVWCTWSSSGLFTFYLQLHNVRVLIAYPLMIYYSVFALMAVFV